MASLKDATAPRDTSKMTLLTSPGTAAALQRPPLPVSADPEFSPLALAPIPPVMGTSTDASRQFYRQGVSQLRMPPLPTAAAPAAGAQAASQAIQVVTSGNGPSLEVNNTKNPVQDTLNLTGTGVSYGPGPGQVQIAVGAGDGITHGDTTDWWNDSAFAFWRDDFATGANTLTTVATGGSSIGELKWDCIVGSSATFDRGNGGFSNPGIININSGPTLNTYTSLYWPLGSNISGNATEPAALPLLDYAGWKMVWVFTTPLRQAVQGANPFPLAKKSLYCGLTPSPNGSTGGGYNISGGAFARPPWFMGVRFDTDPGKTYALTSVAAASGGLTIYTGSTLTLAGGTEVVGSNVTIAGFTNGANNGTFLCVNSTSTTITVVNPSGVLETHPGTAVTPSISDSTFKFESVANLNFVTTRINNAGQVVDTGIIPVQGAFYRLEMLSTTPGVIKMTLSGGLPGAGVSFSSTLTSRTYTTIGSGGAVVNFARGAGLAVMTAHAVTAPYTPSIIGTSCLAVTAGTKATISAAGQSFYNGVWTLYSNAGSVFAWFLAGANDNTTTGTVTYNPGVIPFFSWGNDSQTSPPQTTIGIDFFSLVINGAGLGGNGTAVQVDARYF